MVYHRTGHGLTRYQRRAAQDTAVALRRLSAAAHTAAEDTRHTSNLARDRATRATLALRGQTPPSPWRWAGYGLATGIVLGAATATILHRTQHPTPPRDHDPHGDTAPDPDPAALSSARTLDAATAAAAKLSATAASAARTIRDTLTQPRRTNHTIPDNTIPDNTAGDDTAGDDTDGTHTEGDHPNPAAPTPPPQPSA